MKSLLRSLVLSAVVAAFFGWTPKSQAQLAAYINVSSGPYGIANVTGNWVVHDYVFGDNSAGSFVTDGNGNASIYFSGVNLVFYTLVDVNLSIQITGVPNGVALNAYGYSQNFDYTGYGTTGIQFGAASGPISGQVLSAGKGVNGVSISDYYTSTTTGSSGTFSLGSTPAVSISASKSGVSFSPPTLSGYPGVPVTFTVSSGPISGQITGSGASGTSIKVAGAGLCTTVSAGNGTYTSCVQSAYQLCTVTPSRFGYHFTPTSISGVPPGESGVNFASASTPPSIATLGNLSFSENQGSFTNAISQKITYGDVPAANVTLTASSSNTGLIPNTPQSIQIIGNPGSQSIIFTPIPGATGSTTITISLNDTVNPVVTKTFTVSVNKTAQTPVAGMPVALNVNGGNNLVRVTNYANLAPTSEVTVEFWENVTTVNQYQATLQMDNDNVGNRFNIHSPWPDGSFGTVYWDFGNINTTGRISYQLRAPIAGKWTHFAFVSSQLANGGAGVKQIYENGVLVASAPGADSFTPYTDDLIIGGKNFHGAISDLRIWNVALDATNILQTMKNPVIGNEPGLVLYYRFNEKSGVTIHDSSPSGITGLVQGDAPYPTWVGAQTNFGNFVVTAFSTSNMLYLPGYLQDVSPTNYVWTIVQSNLNGGTLTQTAGGEWNYVPDPTLPSGLASFVYAVGTGPGTLSNTATVNIQIASLNPPVLSAIPNQLILENTSSSPILFTVTDTNTPVDQLAFSEVCDNPNLVAGFQLTVLTNNGGSNATMSLVIIPNQDTIGSGKITVSANDSHNTVSTNFILQVNQKPAYTIVDLGVLTSRFASYGTAINNQGQVVGYCTDGSAPQNEKVAFIYTGFSQGGQTLAIQSNFSLVTAAYSINAASQLTGTMQQQGSGTVGFFYDYLNDPVLTVDGTLGGNSATGFGINDNGTVVGTALTNGTFQAFQSFGSATYDLNIPGTASAAYSINDSGQIVGYTVTNGVTNAFLVTPVTTNGVTASTNLVGFLPGGTNSIAYAINQLGDAVGSSVMTNGFPHAWFMSSGGSMVDLGAPNNMFGATAYGLNGFDQVVGTAIAGNGATHAFLYSIGTTYDLNDLIPYEETNTWTLIEARGINDSGAIVGTGRIAGQTHAFLALPAWLAGQPIARPLGTVPQAPATTVISGPPSAANPFFWDVHSQQLFAIVPCTAEIQWPTSLLNQANPTNTTAPIITVSKVVWPRVAQTHVAGSPVQLMPQGLPANTPFNYNFQSVMYSTSANTAVDQSGVFTCPTNAYSVLRYITIGPGEQPPYPVDAPNVFEVIRSVAWNDPYYLLSNNVPAVIGTPITNATHFDYAGRNGYVFFQKTPYDGLASDPNRAYDLATRTGPIIPVNLVNPSLPVPDQPFVVVWYHTNNIGVAWADTPYRYSPQWPSAIGASNTIVIASLLGSGAGGLPANYLNAFPYAQNNPALTGFNPNEEHALMVGGVLYALRNDLNALYGNLSQPYVLLKYQDANNNNQWAMQVFPVVATNATYGFDYNGTAGTQIQPPVPLSAMQLCSSSNTGTAGPYYHAQVDGSLWARAAGPNGTTTNITLHYWYPLQPGFYYKTNVQVGTCIPWLDHGTGTPVDIDYTIAWPNQYVMPIGQTLTTAVNGLPDITDLNNASIIYDSLNPYGGSTTTNLARLYDPYSARSVSVPANASWPASMKFTTINGVSEFSLLPYYLRLRLIYDPLNNLLSFQGVNAVTGSANSPGAPILLNNVMSIREREEIKSLDGGTDTTDFDHLVDQLYDLTRNPNMLTLNPPGVSTNNFDKTLLIGLVAQTNVTYVTNHNTVTSNVSISIVPQTFGGQPKGLTTGLFGVPPPQAIPPGSTNYPPEYVTVVEDDPAIPGSVVQMYVIQVSGGPAVGSLGVLPGDNAFDQRLTMRHSGDFGGDPDPFTFEWYYYPGDNGGVSPPPPLLDTNGNVISLNGWLLYQPPDVLTDTNGLGANDITLGEGGQSGLLVMSDNWFISRYMGYNIDGSTNWSGWIGQPGGGAQFAEGWITRVFQGLNPFDARSSDFHTDPINTYQSILEQIGPPYAGPIALNADPNYINSIGLLQAYETVLGVGESLSVNGTPPVDFPPANQSLQYAAGKISSLQVVMANEAYAEFSDPTIGFSAGSDVGSLSSSIFAFEDQVPTLLDQELDLLRGRDNTGTSVKAPPVYNRLYWNFTGGNGQTAYVSTFDITDVNHDGFINTADAQIMFPQGHGDAWGYYLSALKTYYDLLRNTNFEWSTGASAILLAGVPVQVNFADEQAFAHAAAGKAQTGANIVQKTYESAYVEDPNGQYQGYEDTDTNRAWGLSEWARRAGQGAYFDWVTVNALLPTTDTNHTGLNRVDRSTVTDIATIPPAYTVLQNELDQADVGLNPLGLAKQSVPFDISPTLIDQGVTHFEQIYDRAVSAMVNAESVWNQANQFTAALRQQQDTQQQFSQNVQAQDQDYKSRLIEIFGYPYAGDIGQPGSAYPQGYTGPDIYHYMYVDMSTFNSAVPQPTRSVSGTFTPLTGPGTTLFADDVPTTYQLTSNNLTVNFPIGNPANLFQPPTSWGQRQAPGEIQNTLNTLLQDQIRLQEAIANYNALLTQIQNNVNLLQAHENLETSNTTIEDTATATSDGLSDTATALEATAKAMDTAVDLIDQGSEIALASVPGVEGLADDALAPLRGTIKAVEDTTSDVLKGSSTALSITASAMDKAAEQVEAQANKMIAANTRGYEMQEQVIALQNQIQQEPALRLECYNQRETIVQDLGNYHAALAKGEMLLQQRCTFAQQAAAQTSSARYQDMTFRIFVNDAIQKYQAQFALAKQYVYRAAIAYDFETDLLGTSSGAGQNFLTSIIQQQSLGQMNGTTPVVGVPGLADSLAQMGQDFAVLKGQYGFNNPQTETGKFSLRYSLFRQQPTVSNAIPINGTFTNDWQTEMRNHIVPDLWQVPEFVRYCRPFAPQSAGPQPGLVISFGTTITYGLNFFGWPLAGGDSAYDPTLFTTKVRSLGVWFDGYDNAGLSTTPRIYLIPVGDDMMRSPTDGLTVREWRVQDVAIPVPFPLGATTTASANYIPMNNSLSGSLNQIRQFSSFLGYTDQGATIDPAQVTRDSRQIGRSVWNTQWMLIIPGGTLLNDPNAGLQNFVNSVSDIKIYFQTYSYSGN
jgi:probable HAF family extracellular repeat protein